jgi:hypothetical protein
MGFVIVSTHLKRICFKWKNKELLAIKAKDDKILEVIKTIRMTLKKVIMIWNYLLRNIINSHKT